MTPSCLVFGLFVKLSSKKYTPGVPNLTDFPSFVKITIDFAFDSPSRLKKEKEKTESETDTKAYQ